MMINDIEVKECAGTVFVKWHRSGMLPPTIEMTPDEAVHVAIEMRSVAERIIAASGPLRRGPAGMGHGGTVDFGSLAGADRPPTGDALTLGSHERA